MASFPVLWKCQENCRMRHFLRYFYSFLPLSHQNRLVPILLFSIKFCPRALISLEIHYLLSTLKNTNLLKNFPLKLFFAFYLSDSSQNHFKQYEFGKASAFSGFEFIIWYITSHQCYQVPWLKCFPKHSVMGQKGILLQWDIWRLWNKNPRVPVARMFWS